MVLAETIIRTQFASLEPLFLLRLCSDGLWSFSRLLQEYFQAENANVDEEIKKRIQMKSSAYVSLYKVPPFLVKTCSCCVFMKKSEQRFLHHFVVADTYYGCTSGRFDIVMVEADNAQMVAKSI